MSSPLADILGSLTPLHEAMAAFERGGPSCAKAIERLYRGRAKRARRRRRNRGPRNRGIDLRDAGGDDREGVQLVAAGLFKEPLE
jgi:hypothetical protein